MPDANSQNANGRDLAFSHIEFIKALRTGISPAGHPAPRFGLSNPAPETPNALVREILAGAAAAINAPNLVGRRVGLLFTLEFGAELLRQRKEGSLMAKLAKDMNAVTVMTAGDCEATRILCSDAGFAYADLNEMNNNEHNALGAMKFDVVLGNPPFEDVANASKSTASWPWFFQVGFRMLAPGGAMAMITPQTWMAPKQERTTSPTAAVRDIIRDHAVCLNLGECRRHFEGVGSTFCYSIVTKAKSKSTRVITDSHDFEADPAELCDLMTRDVSPLSLSIMRKFKTIPKRTKAESPVPKGDMAETKDALHPYEVWYCRNTFRWSDQEHPLQNVHKLIWHNQTTANVPVYDEGARAPGIRGAVFPVKDKLEAESIISFLETAPMRYVVSQQRFHHGFLNTAVVSESIPELDYSAHPEPWTDAEAAGVIGLTDEEVDEIWAVLDDE